MADYKELLRRAVEALPENNGAARRAVYEKARAALVGQLRAINPPLAARDITTHRLQLEDCIRQVEQEASEANIAGMVQDTPRLPPVFAAEAKKSAPPPVSEKPARSDRSARAAPPAESIEDIIVAAGLDTEPRHPGRAPETKTRQPPKPPVAPRPERAPAAARAPQARPELRALPSIVARAEAAKGRSAGPSFSANLDGGRRSAAVESPRRDARSAAAAKFSPAEYEDEDADNYEAMTAVREVEVENGVDPQGTIDRAIAALDREARGDADDVADIELDYDDEPAPPPPPVKRNGANGKSNGRSTGTDLVVSRIDTSSRREREREPLAEREREPTDRKRNERDRGRSRPAKEFANPRRAQAARAFDGMPRAQAERRGLGAVAIFAIIFAVLLVGAGGAGFWAYQQGYLDLESAFGGTQVAATQTPAAVVSPAAGNTDAQPEATEPATALRADDRLPTTSTSAAPETAPLALQSPAGTADRLDAGPNSSASQAIASVDPGSISGSQSLLLEASDNGGAGAVPFSGTVEWSKGADEVGLPTLVGKANIPARNLSVEILIRKNVDPKLPASHLMEINFLVSDTFIGGSIAGLPGVLLKDQELVQGTPLVGASARVVGNSFLFALSAAAQDGATNANLLTSRKWMDLALIYASGKRAIITLEKDAAAQALFSEVFATWGAAAPASAG